MNKPGCKHTRFVYRDRLNVALLMRANAYRAECHACGALVSLGPANDTPEDPRVASTLAVELKLAAIIAETLHEDPDPDMAPYHWEACVDIALDELTRHGTARARPRSPIERMVDAACGAS